MIIKLDYYLYNIRNMKQTLENVLADFKNDEISMIHITVDLNFTLKEEEQILKEISDALPVRLAYTFLNSGSKQYTFRRI